jgi:3-hydroxyisobutyrate dehydrogenase
MAKRVGTGHRGRRGVWRRPLDRVRPLQGEEDGVTVKPGETRLGWIGTGVMGASMAGHLMAAGYSMTVHTRSRDKSADLESRGAVWADTPAGVAEASDVTFAIVGFPADVREVFLGATGALARAASGSVLVDMTTSEPALAVEIAAAARAKGVGAVDAPVSGGDTGARNATLSIMIGGEQAPVERIWPLFEIMGSNVVHMGGPGAGQHTKMVNQILIATGMIGVSEALLYAQEAGLDLDRALAAVSGGAAGSWSLSNYGPRMLAGDFDPGFFVDHFVKDMGIALDEAMNMQLSVPGLALAHQLYVALQAQGGGRNGTQALLLALARLSDREWSRSG